MESSLNSGYVKRTQKDYSLSFKLQIVDEIESGQLDRLNAHLKLLEKQKARAEHLAEHADKKVIIFDMLVDMAEKEYDIHIRKNYKPELSKTSKKNKKKQ